MALLFERFPIDINDINAIISSTTNKKLSILKYTEKLGKKLKMLKNLGNFYYLNLILIPCKYLIIYLIFCGYVLWIAYVEKFTK